jgi:hypothetical protein
VGVRLADRAALVGPRLPAKVRRLRGGRWALWRSRPPSEARSQNQGENQDRGTLLADQWLATASFVEARLLHLSTPRVYCPCLRMPGSKLGSKVGSIWKAKIDDKRCRINGFHFFDTVEVWGSSPHGPTMQPLGFVTLTPLLRSTPCILKTHCVSTCVTSRNG